MTEIERSADGRIESVKIPMGDLATKENAKKIQADLDGKEAFSPKNLVKAVLCGMDPTKKVAEGDPDEQKVLNWPMVTRHLNRHLDASKTGRHERFAFMKALPNLWVTVCDLGTDDQKAWVKKRLTKFGVRFGFDIVLPDDPQNMKKIIKKALDKAHPQEAAHVVPG